MITASGLHRAWKCAGSAVLPQVRTETEQAHRGTAIHKFLEDANKLGREAALARVPEDLQPICAFLDLEALPTAKASYAPEVAFAWDVETGKARELGRGTERNYGKLGPNEIAGTGDVIGVNPEQVYVGDFKSGSMIETGPASGSLQLRFLALGACRTYGRDEAIIELLFPREGEVFRSRAKLDAFDLVETEVVLKKLWKRVQAARAAVKAGEQPPLTMGAHCKYCPAFTACPAQTGLIKLLAAAPEQAADEIRLALTPATAAQAYERLKVVREVMKRVEAALYAYAQQDPIALPNGMVFGPVETSREEVDGTVAHRILEGIHGREVADAACELSTSKAAIRRALGKVDFKAPLAQLERNVLGQIREQGGISSKRSISVKEHKSDEPQLKLTANKET